MPPKLYVPGSGAAPTADEIKNQFPDIYATFHNIPELWNILIWATVTGMNVSQVQAAIHASKWWGSHTEAQKAWQATVALQPAEANRQIQEAGRAVRLLGKKMGAGLTEGQVQAIAGEAAQNGYSDDEINDRIVIYTTAVAKSGKGEGHLPPGEFGGAMNKVRSIADEYGMSVNRQEAADMAANLLLQGHNKTGGTSEAGIRDVFLKRAKSLFPSLKEELEAGTTVKQWASPFIQLAAQELEQSPDAITFNDPKWRAMLEGQAVKNKDGSTSHKALTLSEWQAKIRQEPRYGYDRTTGARQQAAQLETELLTRFGGI